MTEIRFYHLQTQTLEQALPRLLMKAYNQGKKILVRVPDEKRVEELNRHLWTFHPDSFLPHGSQKNGRAAHQPIWLTSNDENANEATVLVLTDGAEHEDPALFDLACEMLNGYDPEAVKAARTRWKIYKDQGFTVTYWQQSEQGSWEQKT